MNQLRKAIDATTRNIEELYSNQRTIDADVLMMKGQVSD